MMNFKNIVITALVAALCVNSHYMVGRNTPEIQNRTKNEAKVSVIASVYASGSPWSKTLQPNKTWEYASDPYLHDNVDSVEFTVNGTKYSVQLKDTKNKHVRNWKYIILEERDGKFGIKVVDGLGYATTF